MTKDERLLLEIYKRVKDSTSATINPITLGQELGYKEHLTRNILRGLMQANLLKKYNDEEVGLTPRGKEVAKELL